MVRRWAMMRRIQYMTGFLLVLALIGTSIYFAFIYVSPTCFDKTQNGEEHGIDCGGMCARYCRFEISAPKIMWVQPFKIMDGQYNVVAYVENSNREVGTKVLPYTIKLEDAEGFIIERSGTTVMPPNGIYPIFEGRVMTGNRVPTKTTITFTNEDDVVWMPARIGRDDFFLEERDLVDIDTKPRLNTQVRSSLLEESDEVEIIATIFDGKGKPLTTARTVVEYFAGRSSKKVVFTWPEPIASTLRNCEVPSDILLAIDLSGSMDSDGGVPPEPITSVLSAAKSFVARLTKDDQAGIVTFATGATLVSPLTQDMQAVAHTILGQSIDPVEQQGSTNPGDALKQIQKEFSSGRHNADARKIVVLFTDGLANEPEIEPEKYAIDVAQELKQSGAIIYTIGLGANLNVKFLSELAKDEKHAFIAPKASDLDEIYHTINTAICKDGPTVIDVIAKPNTSFR